MILYKYGDDKSIVYFWQGSATSTDEKGASAIHAARIDNEELGGKAIQVNHSRCQGTKQEINLI